MSIERRISELDDFIRRKTEVLPSWISHQGSILRVYHYAVTRGYVECIAVLQNHTLSPLPEISVGFPNYGTLTWLHSKGLLRIVSGTLDHAVSIGCSDCVRWLLDRGCVVDDGTVLAAAMGGNSRIIRQLLETPRETDCLAIDTLCHHGHEEAVIDLQHRLTAEHISILAKRGHLDILRRLDLLPFRWFETIPASAIAARQFNVFQYLVEKGFPTGGHVLAESAYSGYLYGMQLAVDQDAEVDLNVFSAACISGNVECIKFAAEHLNPAFDFESALKRGMWHCANIACSDDSMTCGRYLLTLGAKCDDEAIGMCIRNDNIWLLELAYRADALVTTPEVFAFRPRDRDGDMCLDFLEEKYPDEVAIALKGVIDSDSDS